MTVMCLLGVNNPRIQDWKVRPEFHDPRIRDPEIGNHSRKTTAVEHPEYHGRRSLTQRSDRHVERQAVWIADGRLQRKHVAVSVEWVEFCKNYANKNPFLNTSDSF